MKINKKVILGVTLLELMVTVAIIAIIALFATPSFMQLIRSERAESQIENMFFFMMAAQEHALVGKRPVVIIPEKKEGDKSSVNNIYWKQKLVMGYIPFDLLNSTSKNITQTSFENDLRDAIVSTDKKKSEYALQEAVVFKEISDVTLELSVADMYKKSDYFENVPANYILFYPDGLIVMPKFSLKSGNEYLGTVGHCGQINTTRYDGETTASLEIQKKSSTPYAVGMHLYDKSTDAVVEECKW